MVMEAGARNVQGPRFQLATYVLATVFVCLSAAMGNALWREGLLQPFVPTDGAFLVASALIAAVAFTVWRPRDIFLVWLVFLPIALALGFYSVFATAGLYGDSL
jgi:hypothetical protein